MLENKITNLNLDSIVIRTENDLLLFKNSYPMFNIDFNSFTKNTGDIGIWATHYLTYKKFLDSKKDYLITVEDDAILFDNFFDLLEFYIQEVPKDFDLLYLDSPDSAVMSIYGIKNNFYDTKSIYVSHATHWFGGITILLSRNGAKKIIDHIENNIIIRPFDYEILESDPPSSQISKDKGGRVRINISGLIPKNENKKFITYSLSRYAQKIASSVFSESLIREPGR